MTETKTYYEIDFVPPSPWGPAQSTTQIAPGIYWISTASHGGYYISQERLADMPQKYKQLVWIKDRPNWFEEDCAWIAVVLTWPKLFSKAVVNAALDLEGRTWTLTPFPHTKDKK